MDDEELGIPYTALREITFLKLLNSYNNKNIIKFN